MLFRQKKPLHNSSYKKLAVHWLVEALCFVSSFVLVDSFVLRNRQLLVAANRCEQAEKQIPMFNFLKKRKQISREEIFWKYFTKNKKSLEDFINSDLSDYTAYNKLTDKIRNYSIAPQ